MKDTLKAKFIFGSIKIAQITYHRSDGATVEIISLLWGVELLSSRSTQKIQKE
jgi:hypothetical protein